MDRRVRAANSISRAWRRRPTAKSRKLSRMARWRPVNSPGGEYKFVRTCSTNGSGTSLILSTDALGVPKFFVGGNNSSNLQLDFSLQQTRLSLGGVVQITSLVPDNSDFTSLFDQWCIEKVEVSILPSYSNAGMSSNGLVMLPSIVHAIDDDDNTAATNLQLQQYGNAQYTQLLQNAASGTMTPLRTFRPKPALAAYQTGATFAYGELTRGPKWLDISYPTVPHYGFKAALDPSTATGTPSSVMAYLDVVVKYHFKFKTVR